MVEGVSYVDVSFQSEQRNLEVKTRGFYKVNWLCFAAWLYIYIYIYCSSQLMKLEKADAIINGKNPTV